MSRLLAATLVALGLVSCASLPELSGGCGHPLSSNDFFGDPPLELTGGLAQAYADMQEPSLKCDLHGRKAWRYSYPGYSKPNVTIRAVSDGRTYKIFVTRTRSSDGGMNFQIVRRDEHNITASQWDDIDAAAAASDFWTQPRQLRGNSDRIILHLQAHVVEGRAETYQLVEVYDSGALSKLEDTLRRLARIDD